MEKWIRRDDETGKVVKIEAVLLHEGNYQEVAAWCGADLVKELDPRDPDPEDPMWGLNIRTPQGYERASYGMYVFKYAGKFEVAHTRPFEEMYTPVSKPHPAPQSIAESRRQRGFADPWGNP